MAGRCPGCPGGERRSRHRPDHAGDNLRSPTCRILRPAQPGAHPPPHAVPPAPGGRAGVALCLRRLSGALAAPAPGGAAVGAGCTGPVAAADAGRAGARQRLGAGFAAAAPGRVRSRRAGGTVRARRRGVGRLRRQGPAAGAHPLSLSRRGPSLSAPRARSARPVTGRPPRCWPS